MNPVPAGYIAVDGKPCPTDETAKDAVRVLLQFIGEDVGRDGLLDTPTRFVRAFAEMTAGYREDPAKILARQFDSTHDEMVVLKDIPFTSICEHHLAVFTGRAAVAYIPANSRVVGLSKLARLVLCFARRLQLQEQLTGQVADALMQHLQPTGAACVITAEHSCMACRGVKLPGATFVTSALRGVLRTDAAARAELMTLLGRV